MPLEKTCLPPHKQHPTLPENKSLRLPNIGRPGCEDEMDPLRDDSTTTSVGQIQPDGVRKRVQSRRSSSGRSCMEQSCACSNISPLYLSQIVLCPHRGSRPALLLLPSEDSKKHCEFVRFPFPQARASQHGLEGLGPVSRLNFMTKSGSKMSKQPGDTNKRPSE